MDERQIINLIEEFMSSKVRERGYYNILTAVTYAGDKDEKFNAEGTAAKNWRSDVYRKTYALISDGVDDIDEIKRQLPPLEW